MRNWLKMTLFVSAFSPTLLVLGGVRWYELGTADGVVYQLILISILGTALPFLIIRWLISEAESFSFRARKVEAADYFLLVFVASYFIPLVAKVAEMDFVYSLLLVFVGFLVAWVVSSIPSHPLLYLFKYRFYKVESDEGMVYMLISRRDISSPKSIGFVKKISSGMLLE